VSHKLRGPPAIVRPTPLPPEWAEAIRRANGQVDLIRATATDFVIPLEYLLPLPERLRAPVGEFCFDIPAGSVLTSARLVKRAHQDGDLGLTWNVPRARLPGFTDTTVFVHGRSYSGWPPLAPGRVRRPVGAFYWCGSYGVWAEEPEQRRVVLGG